MALSLGWRKLTTTSLHNSRSFPTPHPHNGEMVGNFEEEEEEEEEDDDDEREEMTSSLGRLERRISRLWWYCVSMLGGSFTIWMQWTKRTCSGTGVWLNSGNVWLRARSR